MKFEFYLARSKKTGRYFSFHELCSDGYGRYEDNISMKNEDNFQRMAKFSEYQMKGFKAGTIYLEEFKDHLDSEVEFVKAFVTIITGEAEL